jgi:hypothetical protein
VWKNLSVSPGAVVDKIAVTPHAKVNGRTCSELRAGRKRSEELDKGSAEKSSLTSYSASNTFVV